MGSEIEIGFFKLCTFEIGKFKKPNATIGWKWLIYRNWHI